MSTARRSRAAGQSLVELAIIAPILILLFMGTVEIGRLYFAQIAIQEAVQEGSTYAGQVPADTTGIASRVNTNADHPEVTGAIVATPVCTTDTITVSATYPLPMITPLGNVLFGGTFQIGATVAATNLAGSCS